jgi:hypothetical protein
LSSLLSSFTPVQDPSPTLSASVLLSNFRLPNLPREEKLSYIEAQKRKLVEYIAFLDDQAATQHNEDLPPPRREVFPEEDFEKVGMEDVSEEAVRRGWFTGWGTQPSSGGDVVSTHGTEYKDD